jgi:hypothetical protein
VKTRPPQTTTRRRRRCNEKNIVFSSGGRFNDQRVKTFFGTPEYFINNFQMNCIIGTNEKTGNSNAIKFTFDIIESILDNPPLIISTTYPNDADIDDVSA